MTELLTAAQMRAVEQAAIASGEVTGLELMERAGGGVVEAIFEEWQELRKAPNRAVVLCGPGNNGGDGFVVARRLKEWGWEVEVFLYGDPDRLPPDARVNYERWRALGSVRSADDINFDTTEGASLVVDALFGTGLSRPLDAKAQGSLSLVIESAGPGRRPLVVAIDIPSGFDADSGRCLENREYPDTYPNYFPDLTVTFQSAKLGHYLAPCDFRCSAGGARPGRLVVVPLGIDRFQDATRGKTDFTWLIDVTNELSRVRLPKSADGHKYANGHALILSGGPGRTGAARLAARGALRIGAGLVTVGCPNAALAEVAHHLTAIMCRPLDGAPGLAELLEDDRLNALCLGPGLGLGADTQALVLAALKAKRKTVLDADALTRFERNPQVLFEALHENVVLTPHAGEFKRLFPDIAENLAAPATAGPAYSKVDATREAAKRAGCTILFKGPDTVIADPSGRCSINSSAYDRAAPWLATAGSGDVLAGMITGLLARGFSPMQAAETAAWLHTECALSFGPGLIAEDLPEELPQVFGNLGL